MNGTDAATVGKGVELDEFSGGGWAQVTVGTETVGLHLFFRRET